MRLIPMLALLASLSLSAPASASTVFFDDFESTPAGFYNTSFGNFTLAGNVDVVNSGSFGITCSGRCVDLDGFAGAGALTSLGSFAFNAGDAVRLTFDLGGSQRIVGTDDWFAGFSFAGATQLLNGGYNFFGSDVISFPNVTTTGVGFSTSINSSNPIATRSLFFTAGTAGSLTFNIGTTSADNYGPLLDNIHLDIGHSAVPEPSTWAMMIAGFCLIGFAMRQRVSVKFA